MVSHGTGASLFILGSYVYGPSTIYSGHCPRYEGLSNATQRHHEEMKAVMEALKTP